MRMILLLLAALLSGGVILLAFLFSFGMISSLLYTICSSAISVLFIFALFHFIYLYLSKKKEK